MVETSFIGDRKNIEIFYCIESDLEEDTSSAMAHEPCILSLMDKDKRQ